MYRRLSLVIAIIVFSSCAQDELVYEYEEVVKTSPLEETVSSSPPFAGGMNLPDTEEGRRMKAAIEQSAVKANIVWETPAQWTEEKGSGMRLATFTAPQLSPEFQVTIITLSGIAGGLEANIARWARQINVPLSGQDLANFMQNMETIQAKTGEGLLIADLTQLQGEGANSVIGAILEEEGSSVFIKMSGPKTVLIQSKETFRSFCQSLQFN